MQKLILAVLLCLTSAASTLAQAPATPTRPNIVLIVADDLGINDLNCYRSNQEQKDNNTPNIDGLAAAGTKFTSAYCALPICSASRASLLTSKYPARLHLTTYLPGRADAPSQKLLQPRIEPALVPTEQTLAEVLKREGYATGAFGKWHLGGGDSAPKKQGFDVAFEPPGNGDPAVNGGKNELLIMDKAVEFIKAQGEKPYFCYVPHHSPHIMLNEERSRVEKYAKAWNPLYAATVERLDDAVGGILDAIEASPRADDTIIIFTSDNGGLHVPEGHEQPATNNGHSCRAGKGYLYEGGLRVPLIIRWPKGFAGSEIVGVPVSLLDIVPTLLDYAKIDVSKTIGPVDGQSFVGLHSDDEEPYRKALNAARTRTFYWHLPHYTNQGSRPSGAIRHGDHKLIEDYETGAVELYENADLGIEQKNVADKHPEVVAALKAKLVAWRKSVAAQELKPNPDFDEALHRKLYIESDPSKISANGQTAEQIGKAWKEWRAAMNQAVAGRKSVLNNTAAAIHLSPAVAKTHGKNLRYEPEPYKNVLGYWTEVDDWAEWEFDSPIAGKAEIQIHCGCSGGGSEVDVILKTPGAADQVLKWTVRDTGHFQNIVIETLGEVTLAKEKCTLEVRPRKKAGAAIVDIRQVLLVPHHR